MAPTEKLSAADLKKIADFKVQYVEKTTVIFVMRDDNNKILNVSCPICKFVCNSYEDLEKHASTFTKLKLKHRAVARYLEEREELEKEETLKEQPTAVEEAQETKVSPSDVLVDETQDTETIVVDLQNGAEAMQEAKLVSGSQGSDVPAFLVSTGIMDVKVEKDDVPRIGVDLNSTDDTFDENFGDKDVEDSKGEEEEDEQKEEEEEEEVEDEEMVEEKKEEEKEVADTHVVLGTTKDEEEMELEETLEEETLEDEVLDETTEEQTRGEDAKEDEENARKGPLDGGSSLQDLLSGEDGDDDLGGDDDEKDDDEKNDEARPQGRKRWEDKEDGSKEANKSSKEPSANPPSASTSHERDAKKTDDPGSKSKDGKTSSKDPAKPALPLFVKPAVVILSNLPLRKMEDKDFKEETRKDLKNVVCSFPKDVEKRIKYQSVYRGAKDGPKVATRQAFLEFHDSPEGFLAAEVLTKLYESQQKGRVHYDALKSLDGESKEVFAYMATKEDMWEMDPKRNYCTTWKTVTMSELLSGAGTKDRRNAGAGNKGGSAGNKRGRQDEEELRDRLRQKFASKDSHKRSRFEDNRDAARRHASNQPPPPNRPSGISDRSQPQNPNRRPEQPVRARLSGFAPDAGPRGGGVRDSGGGPPVHHRLVDDRGGHGGGGNNNRGRDLEERKREELQTKLAKYRERLESQRGDRSWREPPGGGGGGAGIGAAMRDRERDRDNRDREMDRYGPRGGGRGGREPSPPRRESRFNDREMGGGGGGGGGGMMMSRGGPPGGMHPSKHPQQQHHHPTDTFSNPDPKPYGNPGEGSCDPKDSSIRVRKLNRSRIRLFR